MSDRFSTFSIGWWFSLVCLTNFLWRIRDMLLLSLSFSFDIRDDDDANLSEEVGGTITWFSRNALALNLLRLKLVISCDRCYFNRRMFSACSSEIGITLTTVYYPTFLALFLFNFLLPRVGRFSSSDDDDGMSVTAEEEEAVLIGFCWNERNLGYSGSERAPELSKLSSEAPPPLPHRMSIRVRPGFFAWLLPHYASASDEGFVSWLFIIKKFDKFIIDSLVAAINNKQTNSLLIK